MLQDSQGLDVTTDSPAMIAAINRYINQALAYGKDAIAIIKDIEADPKCAITNAYAATVYLTHETTESHHLALPYLQAAKQYKDQATEREQLYISAIEAWAAGAIDKSIAYLEVLTQKFPRDLIAVQMGQYHYFYQGNPEGLLAIAEKALAANRENHYLYGMIAFGLEQCQRFEEAEEMGRLATQMNRNDPWAHHAVAHVMEMQGRLDEGIAWMESLCDTWEQCNSMLYTHNWWHIALYYLEKQDFQKVLSLYDTHIWGCAWKDSSKDPIGAISLLMRLELRGVEVGHRWQELTPHLRTRIHEHALPFQDLHYIYALSQVGQTDQVTEMLLSMQAHAKTADPSVQRVWNEVAMPAARGIAAYARGQWERAIGELSPILSRLHTLGGSHAQRDLFEQIYLDAWLRAQQNHEALKLLEKRYVARRYIPLLEDKCFPKETLSSERITPSSQASHETHTNVIVKSRITISLPQTTPLPEESTQARGFALARTYAKIIEVVEHLSA
jgi:tetratricopeptide (TPR) repeat protein